MGGNYYLCFTILLCVYVTVYSLDNHEATRIKDEGMKVRRVSEEGM